MRESRVGEELRGRAMEKGWKIVNGVMVYDYDDIEADLIRLGATPEETASLIILHEEERDWDLSDEYLTRKLAWYRKWAALDSLVHVGCSVAYGDKK
jgi:hypothetical protein